MIPKLTVLSIIINFSFGQVSMGPNFAQPYSFGYTVKDKFGEQHRQETGDGTKFVKGNYGYRDSKGLQRQVDYVADKDGFRAEVKTNEPGTASLNPAAVKIVSSAHPYFGAGYGFRNGVSGIGKGVEETGLGYVEETGQGFGSGLGYGGEMKGRKFGTDLGYTGIKGHGFGTGFGYGTGGTKGQEFGTGFGMKGQGFGTGFGYGTGLKGLGFGPDIGYGAGMKGLQFGRGYGYGAGVKGLGLGDSFGYGIMGGGKGFNDIGLGLGRTGYGDFGYDGYALEIGI